MASEEPEPTGGTSTMTTLDPLCPQRMIFDMIDLTCYELIMDPANRRERAGQLNYYLDRISDGAAPTTGRLHTRLSIGVVLDNFCARDAYPRKTWPPTDAASTTADTSNLTEDTDDFRVPLVRMKSGSWEQYIQLMKTVKKDALRLDANAPVLPVTLKETTTGSEDTIVQYNASLSNKAMNTELEEHVIFTRKYDEIIISMRFHQALSNFRCVMEEEMDAAANVEGEDEPDTIIGVSSEDLAEFSEFISKHFTDEWGAGARDLLNELIDVDESNGSISLRPIPELRKVYSRKEFSLERFQGKVERMLHKWNDAILDRPRMSSTGYGKKIFPGTADRPEPKQTRIKPRRERQVEEEEQPAEHHQEEEEEELAAPIPDDEEYEADLEQSTKKKSSRPSKKRRAPEEEDEDEEPDVGPTGTTRKKKKKKRRGKRDRASTEKENHAPAPVEAGPEVKELARARDNLREDVEDPLDAVRAIASTATAPSAAAAAKAAAKKQARDVARGRAEKSSTPAMYKKKKSAKTLVFTTSEEEDSDGEDDEVKAGTTLSEVPNRPVIRTAPKSAEQPKPATQMLTHRQHLPSGALKRKKFTDEEKSAIKLGVERFGFGKWAKIKEYYSEELRDRTSVNIKDCYRTMMKNNEV